MFLTPKAVKLATKSSHTGSLIAFDSPHSLSIRVFVSIRGRR